MKNILFVLTMLISFGLAVASDDCGDKLEKSDTENPGRIDAIAEIRVLNNRLDALPDEKLIVPKSVVQLIDTARGSETNGADFFPSLGHQGATSELESIVSSAEAFDVLNDFAKHDLVTKLKNPDVRGSTSFIVQTFMYLQFEELGHGVERYRELGELLSEIEFYMHIDTLNCVLENQGDSQG